MFTYKSKTVFSSLPEWLKLTVTIGLTILAFLFSDLRVLGSVFVFVLLLLIVSGYRLKEFSKLTFSLLPIAILYLLIFFVFFTNDSITRFAAIILRIYSVFFSFAWFTSTTDLFKVMKWMERMPFPKSFVLSFYIMLRFLPEIEQQYKEILLVQKARGLSMKQPIEYIIGHFVPLIMILLERVDELEIAFYLRDNK